MNRNWITGCEERDAGLFAHALADGAIPAQGLASSDPLLDHLSQSLGLGQKLRFLWRRGEQIRNQIVFGTRRNQWLLLHHGINVPVGAGRCNLEKNAP